MKAARVLAALALACISNAAFAQERGREPHEIVRQLTASQDRFLSSDGGAQDEQKQLSNEFLQRATSGEAKLWESARNRRAVALYLLAGGEGEALRGVVTKMTLDGDEKKLLEGALAFAEGREKEALAALGALEPRNLPADIGGQVALTQGVLNLGVDRAKAMQALDLARLLSPGALVEEAALRRQVFIASEGDDPARFIALSERYRLRFKNSTYASNFRTRFRDGFIRFWIGGDERARGALEQAFVESPRSEATLLLFDAARAAIAQGAFGAAKAAATRAKTYMDAEDAALVRADLYALAAGVLDEGAAAEQLTAIAPARLSPEDRILRESALLAVAALKPPREDEGEIRAGEPTPLMKRAVELIADADALRSGR